MQIRVLRHSASNGVNLLIEAMKENGHGVKKIKMRNSRYRGKAAHLLINWGRHDRANIQENMAILNRPEQISLAADKVRCFIRLANEGLVNNIPRYTTSESEAKGWLESGEVGRVYCRTLTRASEGRGIELATTPDEIVSAPLYTGEVNVARELRVHVFDGDVIDFAQKKKMSSQRRETEGIEQEPDALIRSHSRGWVFARQGVSIPDSVREAAKKAIVALGLDFGAVDIAIDRQGVPKIYEVNTAPGLEGTTVTSYANAIEGYIDRQY